MGKLRKVTTTTQATPTNTVERVLNTPENIAGDINVPSTFITYHGVETNSAIVAIDNTNKAISVVVKPLADSGINDVKVNGESVVTDRIANIELASAIDQKVAEEATARDVAISQVQDNIDAVSGSLAQEISIRSQEISILQTNINTIDGDLATEISNRAQAVSAVRREVELVADSVQQEVADRQAAIEETLEAVDAVHTEVEGVASELEDTAQELQDNIDDVLDAVNNEVANRQAAIVLVQGSINTTANTLTTKINTEAERRDEADRGLQAQIDTIESRADVVDVVATKAALDAYDKSKLTDQDVIKVLVDESQNNQSTYYRYIKTSNSFVLIGAVGPYSTATNVTNGLGDTAEVFAVGTTTTSITNKGYVDTAISDLRAETEAWEQETQEMLDLRFDSIDENLAKLYYCNIWLTDLTVDKINNVATDIVEKGTIINSVTLGFKYNKLPKGCNLTIFNHDYSAMTDETTARKTLTISSLEALSSLLVPVTLKSTYDGSTSKKEVTAIIANGIYYGVAGIPNEIITESWVKSNLNYELSKDFLTNIPLNAYNNSDYIYYVCPDSYGIPMFTLSPAQFRGGVSFVDSIDITNDHGFSETYNIWRSDNAGLGNITLHVEKQ